MEMCLTHKLKNKYALESVTLNIHWCCYTQRVLCRRQMEGCETEENNDDGLFVGYFTTLYQLQRIYKMSENLRLLVPPRYPFVGIEKSADKILTYAKFSWRRLNLTGFWAHRTCTPQWRCSRKLFFGRNFFSCVWL